MYGVHFEPSIPLYTAALVHHTALTGSRGWATNAAAGLFVCSPSTLTHHSGSQTGGGNWAAIEQI